MIIRFWDGEVYAVNKDCITEEMLSAWFSNTEHQEKAIVVYDKEKFYGIVYYQNFQRAIESGKTEYITFEKYVHTKNDRNIWKNLKKMFSAISARYIPVLNENEELLYFAYVEKGVDIGGRFWFENIMENLNKKTFFFLEEIDPQIEGVRIYDLDELAYQFYEIILQHGIDVEVLGEKWKLLFPVCVGKSIAEKKNILNIYDERSIESLEEKSRVFESTWSFLWQIAFLNTGYMIEKYRKIYRDKGIHIFTVCFPSVPSFYTEDEKFRKINSIDPCSDRKSWEIEEFSQQICKVHGEKITYDEWEKEQNKKIYDKIYVNGKELKANYFGEEENKIYILGPCFVAATHVTRITNGFGSLLYRRLKMENVNYSVICIVIGLADYLTYEDVFQSLTLKENDIVLVVGREICKENFSFANDIPIGKIIERRTCDWFYYNPMHTNAIGNQELANIVAEEYLLPLIWKRKESSKYLQIGQCLLKDEEKETLQNYLQKVKSAHTTEEGAVIGSIVMNCNPMTRGHYYLINEARKKVDYLYVFIVEEDKSEFSFKERMTLVKRETATMENVIVVPSGEFVISVSTLPLYFEKAEKKDAKLDAGTDLQIFGNYIASQLNIKKRFVGSEPIDQITRQYNEQMKELLPYYGVSVVEIPRLCINGDIISASKVRHLLAEGQWDELKLYVTEEVFNYLKTRKI